MVPRENKSNTYAKFWRHKQRALSNEDMILALAGQFKRLSHEPEKGDSTGFEPICDAGAVL